MNFAIQTGSGLCSGAQIKVEDGNTIYHCDQAGCHDGFEFIPVAFAYTGAGCMVGGNGYATVKVLAGTCAVGDSIEIRPYIPSDAEAGNLGNRLPYSLPSPQNIRVVVRAPVCGNSICEPPMETLSTCLQDCHVCPDGFCTAPWEDALSCPRDCGHLFNYQGRLTNAAGAPFSGNANLGFRIFGNLTGGTEIWSETQTVSVQNGIYNVLLGSNTPLLPGVIPSPVLYLEVKVNNETLSPRSRLSSTPFALKAEELAQGRLEVGSSSLVITTPASSAVVQVNFQKPYQSPPLVLVSPLSGLIGPRPFIATVVNNITVSGFQVQFNSLAGTATGSAQFTYQAYGK